MKLPAHEPIEPAKWLTDHVEPEASAGVALDVACGHGQNLHWLARRGWKGVGLDRDRESLERAKRQTTGGSEAILWIETDLEKRWLVRDESFDLALVFRYLQRDLFPALKRAVRPGGLLLYETFTIDQPKFGRPRNLEFLLRPSELKERFSDWEILDFFEGIQEGRRAVSAIAAKKPQR